MPKTKVLLIEDEEDIREIVRYNLERDGCVVTEAATGEEGLVAARDAPDLILLDLMLPGIQGLEVCRRLRASESTRDVPLIIVTAKGEEPDIVAGLEMGADDFVIKPFSTRELMARARSVLRRGVRSTASGEASIIRVDPVEIDVARHEVRIDGAPLELTLAEFRLLETMARSPGRVYTRAQLVREITGGSHHIVERNVDVHVLAVRRKLGDHGALVKTVRGVGYKIDDEAISPQRS